MVDVVRLVSNSPLVFSPPPFLWDSSAPAFPSRSQSYFCRHSAEQMSLNGHLTYYNVFYSNRQLSCWRPSTPKLEEGKRWISVMGEFCLSDITCFSFLLNPLRFFLPIVNTDICQLVARHLKRLCQLEKSHLLVGRHIIVPGPLAGSHLAFGQRICQRGTREYPWWQFHGSCHMGGPPLNAPVR